MILLDGEGILEYFEDKVPEETRNHELFDLLTNDYMTELLMAGKAQAGKILIQLQAIYNIPDLKAEDVRMGEFIQELQEEAQ